MFKVLAIMAVISVPGHAWAGATPEATSSAGQAGFSAGLAGARKPVHLLEEDGLSRADVLRIRTKINREIQRLQNKIGPLKQAYEMQSTLCYFKSPAQKNGCDDLLEQVSYRLQNLNHFKVYLEDLLLDL